MKVTIIVITTIITTETISMNVKLAVLSDAPQV